MFCLAVGCLAVLWNGYGLVRALIARDRAEAVDSLKGIGWSIVAAVIAAVLLSTFLWIVAQQREG